VKVALIVQRYGPEVVGGSESLARHYAQSLARSCTVDVLTSCALDHVTWRNHFAPGVSPDGSVTVRRFPVDCERGAYWFDQLGRMLTGPTTVEDFLRYPQCKQAAADRVNDWPYALQRETVRRQGPYSSALLAYLREHRTAYDAFLFCTYLYPTTYFGMQCVPRERILFCPTLHDEPMAYLPIYREVFQRPRFTIFLSEAEQALAQRLFDMHGETEVIGMALLPSPPVVEVPPQTPGEYVLNAGRQEPAKGTEEMIWTFLAFKEQHPSELKLVLIGKEVYPMPRHPDVLPLGFVSEAEKFALMRRARAFIHPSAFESFAIVLLESFQTGTPALVNGHCAPLVEHCSRSKAGFAYVDRAEFIALLWELTTNAPLRDAMGKAGQEYVRERFSPEVVGRKLERAVRAVATAPDRSHRPHVVRPQRSLS
jgi:glycosyltransferase involved in cell wall biosynthesis